jgi:hypothetical protein
MVPKASLKKERRKKPQSINKERSAVSSPLKYEPIQRIHCLAHPKRCCYINKWPPLYVEYQRTSIIM